MRKDGETMREQEAREGKLLRPVPGSPRSLGNRMLAQVRALRAQLPLYLRENLDYDDPGYEEEDWG